MPEISKKYSWDSKHVLLYTCIGILFFVFTVMAFIIPPESSDLKNTLRDLAIAIGPIWVLGLIYQHFLFKEIRAASCEASSDALLTQTESLIKSLKECAKDVQNEVANIMHLRDIGVERGFAKRKDALSFVCEWIRSEHTEVSFVGTSLRGLFWSELGDKESQVGEELKKRMSEPDRKCKFKFLLTHPGFAHLRQGLERHHRPDEFDIQTEIKDSVKRLISMGAKPEEIHFVKATPTCFAIKTSSHMLINPYPLENQALASFCLVVGNGEHSNKIYTTFEENHFVFGSASCIQLTKDDLKNLDEFFMKETRKVLSGIVSK